jgi:hypothetical protein
MFKFVKALAVASLAAAGGLLFLGTGVVFAQGFDSTQYAKTPSQTVQPGLRNNFGSQFNLTSAATSGAANFGFMSKYVQICLAPTGAAKILARFGTALTSSTGIQADNPFNVAATSATIFESGSTGILAGNAMVFSSTATSGAPACHTFPFQAPGMIFVSSTSATVNVNAFAE